MTPADCAVVVCTRDRPDDLARCLASVRRLDRPPGELLVIDNAPSDRRAADVARSYGASYYLERVPGLPHARNLGLEVTRRPIVAYLDDDGEAAGQWIEALVRPFRDPVVAGVAGVLRPVDVGSEAHYLAERLIPMQGFWDADRALRKGDPDWFRTVNFGGFVFGSNMAVRRSAAIQVGGFHPGLGRGAPIAGGDEQYMFYRLLAAGWTTVVTPDAVVLHPYPASTEAVVGSYLEAQESLAGYTLFLMVRHPRHTGLLLRRLVRALGRLLASRPRPAGEPTPSGTGRSARLAAWGRGVMASAKALIR